MELPGKSAEFGRKRISDTFNKEFYIFKHAVVAANLSVLGDKTGITASYNNIGIIYNELGNDPEALKNFFAALREF